MIKVQSNVYDSSTVEGSSYDYKTKDLVVTFKHATYVYYDVEESDYIKFREADSQGKALNKYIKPYRYEKLEE